MSGWLYRLGVASVRRRRLVVASWVTLVVALVMLRMFVGGSTVDNFEVPGVESQKAMDLLEDRFPEQAGATATIVFGADGGVARPMAAAEIDAVLAEVRAQDHVVDVTDPLSGQPPAVSPEGDVAFSIVRYDAPVTEFGSGTRDELLSASAVADKVEVEFGGELVQAVEPRETGISEVVGLATAVIVLLFAFGTLLAMGVTLVTAIAGLMAGLSGVILISSVIDIPTVAPRLATMIGLGVGIDYALFVVSRYRQNLAAGMSTEEAVALANATAGHSVVFAGGTVVIAILGLQLSGIPFVAALGYAAALVVAVAVVAAVTLLPALLGTLGDRIDRFRVPRLRSSASSRDGDAGGWLRWAGHVARRPWRYMLAALLVLLVVAAPVLDMRIGQSDAGAKPTSDTQRRAYDLLAGGFGVGVNGPLVIAVDLSEGTPGALDPLIASVRSDPGVARVSPPRVNPAGDTAVFQAIPTTAPQDEATTDLVHRLREGVLTEQGEVEAFIGGPTASFIDQSDKLAARLPWFILGVVSLSFLLLMVVFRSILVPLKAALLNLLSIGAAYGVVVAVFQWGWGKSLIGLEETVPITSFVPMMMFAILFGLSMDYEVFLLSRIREEYAVARDNRSSVVRGLASTARVITSAALIMISVFLSFVLNDDPIVKMMGIGLATAVFIDATIVRVVLLPATMALVGDANWWLPRWLDRFLPKLDIEGTNGTPSRTGRTVGSGPSGPVSVT